MRIISILTAVVVMASLYLLVFERDAVMAIAQADSSPTNEEGGGDEDVTGAVSVVAVSSQAQEIDSSVLLRGRTEADRQVEVRAETSGKVVSTPLRKGASVQEGQLLCEIEIGTRSAALSEAEARLPEAEARLIEAEARLAEARINDRAASRLSEGGYASETRVASTQAEVQSALAGVQAARAGVRSAEAAIAAAETEIERLAILAPFDGLLESDAAEVGSLLQPGSLCATVIQLDPIKLVGFVPETDVDRISVGARVGARLASGRQVTGQVTFISRSADETTRTFRADVEVANADLSIRDGQTVEMMIEAEGTVAHLVPQSALTLDDDGRLGVRLVVDDAARFQSVSVVRDTTEGVWITGLEESADIIVVGQEFVTDGVPVTVTYREIAG
jgi:multidrug efflux system membrane fusion protein